jgi:hypothetical protein
MTTGVSGASASDLAPSMTLNSAVAVSTEAMETKNSDGLGNYTFDSPPDFTFGATNQQGPDPMDFTFDPITTPGNDDMLAAMQAIQSPNWLGNMLMPGFFWPAEEAMQDHSNNYQNFQAQPAEVLLR